MKKQSFRKPKGKYYHRKNLSEKSGSAMKIGEAPRTGSSLGRFVNEHQNSEERNELQIRNTGQKGAHK